MFGSDFWVKWVLMMCGIYTDGARVIVIEEQMDIVSNGGSIDFLGRKLPRHCFIKISFYKLENWYMRVFRVAYYKFGIIILKLK